MKRSQFNQLIPRKYWGADTAQPTELKPPVLWVKMGASGAHSNTVIYSFTWKQTLGGSKAGEPRPSLIQWPHP